jgi:S1-C subfamily serine protease
MGQKQGLYRLLSRDDSFCETDELRPWYIDGSPVSVFIMRRFITIGPAIIVLIAVTVTLLWVPNLMRQANTAVRSAVVEVSFNQLDDQTNILEEVNKAVRAVGDAVEPSVVHIDVEKGQMGFAGSSGSGWVYDDQGHIVTNAHVIGGANRIAVQFFDGRIIEGKVIGADIDSDIAVIKVSSSQGLIPSRRATGERLSRGDRVFAFGSPFGFKFSMSEGIVSGLGRTARTALGATRISNFIQTDAAVNPGNSGGPLVNVRGRVVGMNVAIATAADARGNSEGQSAGISFAIPLATIESRVAQMISGQPIQSGYMGVIVSAEEPRFIGSVPGNAPSRGVVLSDIFEESPAQRAGLLPGDIVLKIDGETVGESQILISLIASKRPGDSAALLVWRDGQSFEASVTLVERPDSDLGEQYRSRLERMYGLSLDERGDKVVVTHVVEGSLAARCGFVAEQVIIGAAGFRVESDEAFINIIANVGLFRGRPVRVLVAESSESDVQSELTLRRDPPGVDPVPAG